MIIERDKIYIDGYGRKIRIVCTDRKSKCSVVGVVHFSKDNEGVTELYTSDGQQLKFYDPRLDLVKEYQEPVYNWTIWRKCTYDPGLYSNTFTTEALARSHEDIVSLVRIDIDTGEVLQLKV